MVPKLTRRLWNTDFGAIGNLSHSFMTKFNERTANNPDVKYFAWAGEVLTPKASYRSVSSFHLITHVFLASLPSRGIFALSKISKSGSTDGVVEVGSAVWENDDLGPGTHLGTVFGLDQ